MPFTLLDVLNTFYISLQESLPTSSTDVTTSRIPISQAINILTYVVRQLNEFSPFVQHCVIPVTSGVRQYALPTDYYNEVSVRYRGFPLLKTSTNDFTFLITQVTSYPWQYSVFFPGSTASPLTITGTPYLIIDPPPSETSPTGTPPTFPGFNDAFLMVTYQARMPTDFSTSNYTTYIFALPEELAPTFSDLMTAYIMSLEGKNTIYTQRFGEVVKKITNMNSYQLSVGENSPPQVQQYYWDF